MNMRAYNYEGMNFQASDYECPRKNRFLVQITTQLERLRSRIRLAARVRQERQQLTQLDEHLLQDMGISKYLVLMECQRRYFDIPAYRM